MVKITQEMKQRHLEGMIRTEVKSVRVHLPGQSVKRSQSVEWKTEIDGELVDSVNPFPKIKPQAREQRRQWVKGLKFLASLPDVALPPDSRKEIEEKIREQNLDENKVIGLLVELKKALN